MTKSAILELLGGRRNTFIDIGARGGLPPQWAPFAGGLNVVAFDADRREAARLQDEPASEIGQLRVYPMAVWNETGPLQVHITRSPGCSSVYRPRVDFLRQFPDAERFDVVETVDVQATTLDEVLTGSEAAGAFIKIDAQGGTLPVLQGATRTLTCAVGLEVEVEFCRIYDEEPLFGEVDTFLCDRGFELVDLRGTYWRRALARDVPGCRGQLVFADALYLVSPATLAERLKQLDVEQGEQLCGAAMLTCAVYGLYDWAVCYAAQPGWRGPALPKAGGSMMSRLAAIPFRQSVGLLLKDLGDALIESPGTWAVAEQRLGGKLRSRYLERVR